MDNQNSGGMNLGELSTIRNILMGQQMAEYEQSFNEVKTTIEHKEAATNQKIVDLENQMNERFATLENDMNMRFDKLEALLLEHVRQINERVSTVSNTDKKELGKMLAAISQQLIGEE